MKDNYRKLVYSGSHVANLIRSYYIMLDKYFHDIFEEKKIDEKIRDFLRESFFLDLKIIIVKRYFIPISYHCPGRDVL